MLLIVHLFRGHYRGLKQRRWQISKHSLVHLCVMSMGVGGGGDGEGGAGEPRLVARTELQHVR